MYFYGESVRVNNFNLIFRKLKLAKTIIFSKTFEKNVFVATEDQTKASIKLSLIKNGIKNDTVESEILIKRLVDNIYEDFDKNGFSPLHTLEEVCTTIFKDQAWNLAIAAGVATMWELKVRVFAERIGVSNLVESKNKSKKAKNMHQIGYKDLDAVIKDINEKLNKKLLLRLSSLNELRGALVHTNLHQLRILYNNSYKNFKEELKGNVISFSLKTDHKDLQNLSDSVDSETAESQDIFAWFLEGTNSRLLNLIITEFEKSIYAIDDIIGFKAHSHHECDGFFQTVFFKNIKLSAEQEDVFIKRDTFFRTTKEPTDFFKRIYSYLNIN